MSAQQSSENISDSSQTSEANKTNSDSQDNNNSETKIDDKVQGLFDAMDRRLNHQSAYIGKLEKTVKSLNESLASGGSDNNNYEDKDKKSDNDQNKNIDNNLINRVRELEEKQKVLNSIAGKQKERAKLQEIRAALEVEGVAGVNAERFAKLIAVEQADAISVEDNNGDFLIRIKEGDGFSSLKDWTHAYLQTDEGQAFLPPKQNPVRGNAARGQAMTGTKIITEEEAQHIDPKELQSGKYEIKSG